MLTRLEVDGFKNLDGLRVDFGPFTCIAGENASGKSNLFDAIQLLSLLADRSLMEAAQEVRSTRDVRTGDARDLFGGRGQAREIRFAAEMIVPFDVEDDFGQPTHPTTTFLRYEVRIGFEEAEGPHKPSRLVLLSEDLRHITLGEAHSHLKFPHAASRWRHVLVRGRRSGVAYISTDDRNGDTTIIVHQDGGSRGQPRRASAGRAPATVISTTSGADDPTVLAARREMQQWRRLALEPSALRSSDRYTDPRVLSADGHHLAGSLYRIATTLGPTPEDVYARVASRLAGLGGLDVWGLSVDDDERRELLTIVLREGGGVDLPARSLSEGTLRFLALCVMLEDPIFGGLICMEEPENGIHPGNVPAMVDLVRDLAVDPLQTPGPDNPFRQVIVNTHSPVVVQSIAADDLVVASSGPARRTKGLSERTRPARILRLQPLSGTWRDRDDASEPATTVASLVDYLREPPNAQLSLPA